MANPNLNLAEAIQAVQKGMEDVTTINDPSNYRKLLGFLDWEFSSSNGRSIQAVTGQTSSNGKYKPVEIRYKPKKGDGDIMDAETDYSCAKGTTRREIIQNVEPTLFAGDKFTVDEMIIREGTPKDIQRVLQDEINDAMRNAREKMDLQQYTAATNAVGANPAQTGGTGSYATLEMLNADGTLNADVFDTIKNDQEDNYMVGEAGLIGLGNMRKAQHRLAVGNIQDGGIDFAQVNSQFGMAMYKDQWTTSIQGAGNTNRILAMYPGLTQFYQYNYYKNMSAANSTENVVKTTIQDPVYPITWDFSLKYDDGCDQNSPNGYYVGQIFAWHDLWVVPDTAFGEGYSDNLNDFTGIVGYDITQAS